MAKYFEDNEEILQKYGRLVGLKASEQFILENPRLASEYAANWLTIECLNLAIDGKTEDMCNMARQCIVLQYLLELSKSLNADATNTNVIKNFFKKFQAADPSYMKMYEDEVVQFQERLRRRAKEKRDQAIAEYESEEKAKRIASAPGGIDPQEAYDSLPDEMKKCFDEQNIGLLQKCAETMDKEVFAYHLQRCIDSGLWVPNANAAAEEDESNLEAPRE
jgi:cell division cycle protein 37